MKRNDKLVAVLGVVVLVLASFGIYYWDVEAEVQGDAMYSDFVGITGVMTEMPDGITVPSSDPFYAIIATPLAINYCEENEQHVVPLLVKDIEDPSDTIAKIFNQVQIYPDLEIDDTEPANGLSVDLAMHYWEQSDAALLIEDNEQGYTLGVALAPVASYLRIPILVVNETDTEYVEALAKLGVEYTLVCGDIEGYGNYKKFEDIDEVLDFTTEIIREKFEQEVNYITLTNPKDAFPPKVLNTTEVWSFGPKTVKSGASTTGFVRSLTSGGKVKLGEFTIPSDYKYALVKFWGDNLDFDGVDEFGDSAGFSIGIMDENEPTGRQKGEINAGSTRTGGWGERDSNGNIIRDYVYAETVLYDRGGAKYEVMGSGTWLTKTEGKIEAKVVVEKLESPTYAMMKGLSSIAPYLTAYRQGIVFAKQEFAFTADDDVITSDGKTSPGPYMALKNMPLIALSNDHIIEEIHEPLNNLLAKLANIELKDDRDVKRLRDYYAEDPVYIAVVGGATMLPQYCYENYNQPIDIEHGNYGYGAGTQSDVIYGNIDPIPTDWSNLAEDQFTKPYPFQENIVGRITGPDAQDASALVARSVFYEVIVENQQGDWKDTFGLLMGGGSDFRKPPIRFGLLGDILGIVNAGWPIKLWTGYTKLTGERTRELIAKPLEFDVREAWGEHAQNVGFSDAALDEIKSLTLVNKIFFNKRLVADLVGESVTKGGEIMQSSNFIWANGHGSTSGYGLAGPEIAASGFGGRIIRKILIETLPLFVGGFIGPGSALSNLGDYGTRSCSAQDLGPSFYWLESCICGKIDGVYPKQSLGQAILHSGVATLVASSTTTNIGGGYIEPKNRMYDTTIGTIITYLKAKANAKKGIYADPHFGYRLYNDLCEDLRKDDSSIGLAFRNAKNQYLDADGEWLLWWSPPLVRTGDLVTDYEYYQQAMENYKNTARGSPQPMMENKFTTYQEYILFGDPALNLYEPINNG